MNELIWNDNFRKWVLSPDADSNAFWNNWLKVNPKKKPLVNEAKKIIIALTIKEPKLSDETIALKTKNILNEIDRRPITTYINK